MFYIKSEVGNGITIKAEINDDNVFTTCPECGEEHLADLQDAVIDGMLDLYGTAIYCSECSEKLASERAEAEHRAALMGIPREAEYYDAMVALKKVWEVDGVSPKERLLRLQKAFPEVLRELPPEAFQREEGHHANGN